MSRGTLMSPAQRIEWIDNAKGIGIILVIIGHIHFCPSSLKTFLCAFHMPLFFFLFGVTFKKEKYNNALELLRDKTKKIVSKLINQKGNLLKVKF